MKKTFYAYKNDKMGYFNNPFSTQFNQTEMKEMIRRTIKDAKPEDHVEELSLYEVFSMDDKTGKITVCEQYPEYVCSLTEFMDYGRNEENAKEN